METVAMVTALPVTAIAVILTVLTVITVTQSIALTAIQDLGFRIIVTATQLIIVRVISGLLTVIVYVIAYALDRHVFLQTLSLQWLTVLKNE